MPASTAADITIVVSEMSFIVALEDRAGCCFLGIELKVIASLLYTDSKGGQSKNMHLL